MSLIDSFAIMTDSENFPALLADFAGFLETPDMKAACLNYQPEYTDSQVDVNCGLMYKPEQDQRQLKNSYTCFLQVPDRETESIAINCSLYRGRSFAQLEIASLDSPMSRYFRQSKALQQQIYRLAKKHHGRAFLNPEDDIHHWWQLTPELTRKVKPDLDLCFDFDKSEGTL